MDSIIDQICQRVPSIPLTLRIFCKAIHDKMKDTQLSQQMMAKYIIHDWLAKVAFQDHILNGLLKTYSIKQNASANIKLMGIVLNKLFQLDSTPFHEEILIPFNKLYDQKRDKIKMFYMELIDIPEIKNLTLEAIFEEQAGSKYHHHSMCLSLEHIKILYKFFGTFKEQFSQKSRQSVTVLTDDIDYMDKEAHIFSSDPIRKDSMLFNKKSFSGQLEPHIQHLVQSHKTFTSFYPFFKSSDRSHKVDSLKREELVTRTDDIQVDILKKNLKLLLLEIDDLDAITHLV